MNNTPGKIAIVAVLLGIAVVGVTTFEMNRKRKRGVIAATLATIPGAPNSRTHRNRPRTRAFVEDGDDDETIPAEECIQKSKYFNGTPPSSPSGTEAGSESEGELELVNNSGGGDCLFYCFKEALKSVKVHSTIRALRGLVAKAATEDQLDTLKAIYTNAKEENEYTVLSDYMFMNGVENMQQLRKAMMRRSYWGDEMAIHALEDATGLKAVVFTTQYGEMQIAKNIGDDFKEKPPSGRYILLLLHHMHYQLIKYKGRSLMKKSRLPPEVREAVEADRQAKKTKSGTESGTTSTH